MHALFDSHMRFILHYSGLLYPRLLLALGWWRGTNSLSQWHWRMRASSLFVATEVDAPFPCGRAQFSTIFCSSMLNLAELCALRPDLVRSSARCVCGCSRAV